MRRRGPIAFLSGIFAAASAFGEPTKIAGTSVSMDPPPSFAVAERFPGFAWEDLLASIMVTEIPGPVDEVKKGMARDALATKGMTLLGSETATIAGQDALFIKVAQTAGEIDFWKWIAIVGDDHATTLIAGTFPKASATELEGPIKRSILSATWGAPIGIADHFEGLLYRVEPTEKLKLAGRMGNMLMLTESGGQGPLPANEARFIVGNSVDSTAIGALRSFSHQRAAGTASLKQVEVIDESALKADGLSAHELVAAARDDKSDLPMRLYQMVAADKNGYFILQGLVPADRAAEMIPEFKQVARSFHRTKP